MKTTNLTIIEAMQSGLPFKRGHWNTWDVADNTKTYCLGEITAQDWQIKLPEVTITREKLAEAWDKTVYLEFNDAAKHQYSVAFRKLCESLGL